jgi:hypothetical protein
MFVDLGVMILLGQGVLDVVEGGMGNVWAFTLYDRPKEALDLVGTIAIQREITR